MIKYNTILLLILFWISACSNNVVYRDNKGQIFDGKPGKTFQPVKKKVALLAFFNESPYGGSDLAVVATEELRKELARTGEFTVDPTASKNFGDSKEVYAGGGVKMVQLARKAKTAGVNLAFYGRIIDARAKTKTDEIGMVRKTQSYTESKIEIRIFDVNTSKEVFNEVLNGYADDSTYRFFQEDPEERLNQRQDLLRYAVKVAIRRSVPKLNELATKLEWVGRVAKVLGTKIYVNAGRSSGLNVGDILKVITEGEEIYDPETGALIGISKGEVKGTVEIIDYFGQDGTIAILHSGGSVQEGDFVQLY